MTEEDRVRLYWALLRGIAEQCQDQLCAADEQHDWGQVVATDHWPDIPLTPTNGALVGEMKIMRSYRRDCRNCGKVQRLPTA